YLNTLERLNDNIAQRAWPHTVRIQSDSGRAKTSSAQSTCKTGSGSYERLVSFTHDDDINMLATSQSVNLVYAPK
ncbi:MAG: hypothetical protein ACTS7I_03080, partial [Candidatus Hodgkinia cicadicola]